MVSVRFVKQTVLPGGPLYHPGEVADLEDRAAERVLDAHLAERIETTRDPAVSAEAPARRLKR